jgi:DNA-binding SARP family transcriptional activator
MDDPRIRLVGPLAVDRGGRVRHGSEIGSRKARTLLAVLATARRRVVTVDRLAEILWPDRPPQRPAENVATLVSRIRATLGPEVVTGGRGGYRLGDPVRTDVLDAEALLTRGAAGDAAAILAAAPLLSDEPDAEWLDSERTDQAETLRRARYAVAEEAVRSGQPEVARVAAAAAVADDRYDEQACRLLMRAYLALGEPIRALAAYDRLRAALADDLGVDPADATRALHLEVLRGGAPVRPGLAGRDDEMDRLARAWREAGAGRGGVVLIGGEAGIGKTRLADEIIRHARSAGRVLSARCYQAERSLFLQPIVEALTQLISALPADRVRAAVAGRAAPLAGLIPELDAGAPAPEYGSPDEQRRRAYDAVLTFLRRLSRDEPILLTLDDLQNAGTATVELVHYLARQLRGSRLLVVATVREDEGRSALGLLAPVAETITLGALSPAAITRLAEAAGQAGRAAEIERRTRGHTLFVVESLRALAAGDPGPPESLRAAVLARAAAADVDLLRAAAVLGPSFAPTAVAGLLGIPVEDATRRCERLLAGRLTVVAGRSYEFANDLIQEVLYESTPEPTRIAHHLRAADVLADNPEATARHAAAGGDHRRAARAWLAAGRRAAGRYALADAEALFRRAISAAARVGDEELIGRSRLARGQVREAGFRIEEALSDYTAAVQTGRRTGDRRLHMAALHELAGPIWSGAGRPVDDGMTHLGHALRLAEQLGDRGAQARLHSRLAILDCNRLRFTDAIASTGRAREAAAAAADEGSRLAALDARKTVHAYLGQIGDLTAVLDELEPRVRRNGDLGLLQWCVFESSFPHLAAGRWAEADDLMAEAVRINTRSGYAGYHAWFEAHRGWLARMAGRLDDALEIGRRTTAMDSHAWIAAAVLALYGTTLLAAGRAAEAVPVLHRGLAIAETHRTGAYRLRCLAPLAEATGSADRLRQADAALRQIDGPPWLYGADAYFAAARAWRRHGDQARADEIVGDLLAAGQRTGWTAPLQGQISSASIAAARSAPSVSTGR